MSVKNPVGNIPKRMPILRKLTANVAEEISLLSNDDLIELTREVKLANRENCTWEMYEFAQGILNVVLEEGSGRSKI